MIRGEYIAGTVPVLCGTAASRPQTLASVPDFVNGRAPEFIRRFCFDGWNIQETFRLAKPGLLVVAQILLRRIMQTFIGSH
jgi:hypothetical protein